MMKVLRNQVEVVFVCNLLFHEQAKGMLNMNQVVDVRYGRINQNHNTASIKYTAQVMSVYDR